MSKPINVLSEVRKMDETCCHYITYPFKLEGTVAPFYCQLKGRATVYGAIGLLTLRDKQVRFLQTFCRSARRR